MFIKSENIYLRALEKTDLQLLYSVENDTTIWQVSNTITPFSEEILKLYLENLHQDIYSTKQLRLMVCNLSTNDPIGTIDLFDFDPFHQRVGVGILIFKNFRNNGFASQAIKLLKEYVFGVLLLNQMYCNVGSNNKVSLELFIKNDFKQIGIKKYWNKISVSEFEDEIMLQCINE